MSNPIHVAKVVCDNLEQFNACVCVYIRDSLTFEANANTLIIYLQGY